MGVVALIVVGAVAVVVVAAVAVVIRCKRSCYLEASGDPRVCRRRRDAGTGSTWPTVEVAGTEQLQTDPSTILLIQNDSGWIGEIAGYLVLD